MADLNTPLTHKVKIQSDDLENSTKSDDNESLFKWDTFSVFFIAVQSVLVVLYGIFVRYDQTGYGNDMTATALTYGFYMDVHVMIFLGFGFLMTFLRKNGFTAIGHSFVVAAFCVELSLLVVPFFQQAFTSTSPANPAKWHKVELNVISLVNADVAAAAILITFGALIGKVSLLQMCIIVIVETIAYSANASFCGNVLKAVDMGGSVFVHTFGAYFGVGAAIALNRDEEGRKKSRDNNTSSYTSDIFSLLGTIFLWIYWPSFNSALAASASLPDQQSRVIVNTLISISASVLCAFTVSKVLNKGRFNAVEIQNSTLAGGVAIGTACNLVPHPFGAMLIGIFAGLVSVLGYRFALPYLKDAIGLDDTCGVHNLHGMPGVLGGIAAAIVIACGGGDGIIPEMMNGNRSAGTQVGFQLAALAITLVAGTVIGYFTGFVLSKTTEQLPKFYHDECEWDIERELDAEEGQVLHPALASFVMPSHSRQRSLAEIKKGHQNKLSEGSKWRILQKEVRSGCTNQFDQDTAAGIFNTPSPTKPKPKLGGGRKNPLLQKIIQHGRDEDAKNSREKKGEAPNENTSLLN